MSKHSDTVSDSHGALGEFEVSAVHRKQAYASSMTIKGPLHTISSPW